MIDPLERWREPGEKPDYAGLLTFGTLPYTQDPADLKGIDVAIVGFALAGVLIVSGLAGFVYTRSRPR